MPVSERLLLYSKCYLPICMNETSLFVFDCASYQETSYNAEQDNLPRILEIDCKM